MDRRWNIMNFDLLLYQAQEGSKEAIAEIYEMYNPLLIKNAIVDGIFDEDLYQELVKVLLFCVQRFQI